jgi:hypothetical protein
MSTVGSPQYPGSDSPREYHYTGVVLPPLDSATNMFDFSLPSQDLVSLGMIIADDKETNMNWLNNDLLTYVAQDPNEWNFMFDPVAK